MNEKLQSAISRRRRYESGDETAYDDTPKGQFRADELWLIDACLAEHPASVVSTMTLSAGCSLRVSTPAETQKEEPTKAEGK